MPALFKLPGMDICSSPATTNFLRRKLFMALQVTVVITIFNLFAEAQSTRLQVIKVKDADELKSYFKYTGKDVPLISGHRGGIIKGYPENSIEAMEHTLKYTPAFFEIDPRVTKDSVIILMHDATLERTTNGTGKVSDYTWEELKKLKLKDKEGNVTTFRIPTLEEAIAWAKGKTILNLDKKDVPPAMTAKKLKELKVEGHVMVTVHNAKDAKFYYDGNKSLMFSAFVHTKKALEEYEQAGIPWSSVMAYIGPTYKPENKELQDMLHARGVMCMISAAPTYDKLPDPSERKRSYQEIIKSGADVIESDLPIEAAEAIRPLIPKQSTKLKHFGRLEVR
jgi:glycerophosphoryl diester phosphodiesterase